MDRLQVDRLPDAYERLLLDVIKGDRQNFVRTGEIDELEKHHATCCSKLLRVRQQNLCSGVLLCR